MTVTIKNNANRWMFYAIAIDILFLPYIRAISLKASMLLVVIWYLIVSIKGKLKKNTVINVIILICLATASVLYGMLVSDDLRNITIIRSNIQNLVLVLYTVLFIDYFTYTFLDCQYSISRLMKCYLAAASVFMVIFWISPLVFFSIRKYWTLGGNDIVFTNIRMERFCFITSEPNNFAAMISVIVLYLKYLEHSTNKQMIWIYFLSLLLVATTMSLTGMLLLLVTLTFCLTFNEEQEHSSKITLKAIVRLIFIMCSIVLLFNVLNMDDSLVYKSLLLRIEGYLKDLNFSGSRINIWANLIREKNLLLYTLLGKGTYIIIDGTHSLPHNGHLYLIYGYGFVFYILFMRLFFPNPFKVTKPEFVIMLVIFIIFTMNTVLGDMRVSLYFTIVVAKIRSRLVKYGSIDL